MFSCILWWAFDEVAYMHIKRIEVVRNNFLKIVDMRARTTPCMQHHLTGAVRFVRPSHENTSRLVLIPTPHHNLRDKNNHGLFPDGLTRKVYSQDPMTM